MLSLNVDASDLGRMRDDLRAEQRRVEGALTFARRATAGTLKERLRAQVRATTLGQRVANTWRSKPFHDKGVDGAAWAWSKAPAIISGFDHAGMIRAKGGRFLAIPTEHNRRHRGGRAKQGAARVTAKALKASGAGFLLPIPGGYLWCVKVARRAKGDGQGRTWNRPRSLRGPGGLALSKLRAQGFIPLYTLLRFVRSPKLLDVRKVAETGPGLLIDALEQKLARD